MVDVTFKRDKNYFGYDIKITDAEDGVKTIETIRKISLAMDKFMDEKIQAIMKRFRDAKIKAKKVREHKKKKEQKVSG